MRVFIVRTNELCSKCLYLPAEDLNVPSGERLCAVGEKDLCRDCLSKRDWYQSLPKGNAIGDRVRANSPWLKDSKY